VYSAHLRSIILVGSLKALLRLSVRVKNSFTVKVASRVKGIHFQTDFMVA
jgi:hypothetical protein